MTAPDKLGELEAALSASITRQLGGVGAVSVYARRDTRQVVIALDVTAAAQLAGPGLRCDHCEGTGRRRLSPAEAQTFAVVTDEWQDTRQVRAALPVRVLLSATANRLAQLEAIGLVESTPWLAVRPYKAGAGMAKLYRRRTGVEVAT